MSYYLQMDGVDDRVLTPSITFNKIEMKYLANPSGWKNYFDVVAGSSLWRVQANGGVVNDYLNPGHWQTIVVDGVNKQIQTGTNILTKNAITTAIFTAKSRSNNQLSIFSSVVPDQFMLGDIYYVKLYNDENLVAHYDMSTGTVQDQSGNGNHATLTGGTWVQDTPPITIPRLQMDGVNDYIQTPSFGWDNVELDLSISPTGNQQKILSITSSEWGYIQESTRPLENWDVNTFSGVTVNGVAVTNNSNFIPEDERITLKIIRVTNANVSSYLFAHRTDSGYLKGVLYSAKFYLGNSLVAHYDTSTGTLQDQSGNGKHATLVGGTWVDDGGGEPEPEPVIHTLSLSDSITTNDTISKRLSVVVADTIATNEVNNENVNKTVNDSIGTDDSISYTQGKAVNLSDSIAILDSISKTLTRSISDSVGLSDTDDETVLKSLIDNIALSDSISTFGGKSILLTDSIIVADSISTTKQLSRLFTESINLSDSYTKQSAQSIKLYDVIITNDNVDVFNPDAPELVGVIHLRGRRDLFVYLQGKRELFINLQGGVKMVPNQNFSMISGDTTTLVININENLVGASVKWAMKKRGASTVDLSKNGSIVDGKIHIVLDKEDTEGLSGLFMHECEVTDQSGNVSTVTSGSVNILADMI